jgi:antitoxin HicB
MTVLNYPITLTDDDGTYLVDFVDFPDVHSVGDTVEEALREAVDGLLTGVEMYIADRRAVPLPSAADADQLTVALSVLETSKVLQWNETLAKKPS